MAFENHPNDSRVKEMGDVCTTVTSRWGTGGGNVPFVANRMVAFGEYVDDDTASAMKARDYKDATDLIAYSIREDAKANTFSATEIEVSNAIQALVPSVQSHHAQTFITESKVVHGTQDPCVSDIAFAQGRNNGGENVLFQHPSSAVRRLTPIECERLQGFKDGHTNIPWRGKPESPDGLRYKALGNSMAVPVMNWIGKRISLSQQA
jgi:DNA (cytosine-5)-methyltransferase 1